MRYWWVNHKKTIRQEIDGGFLWSPWREANGAYSQYYENMRIAEPGDLVLSFAKGIVGYAGTVLDFATPVSKPSDFRAAGQNWSSQGWLLPVGWMPLSDPVAPTTLIEKLKPLLPKKYSPINPANGKGYQKAYLAEISRDVVAVLIGAQLPSLEPTVDRSSPELPLLQLDRLIEQVLTSDTALDETTRQQIVLARRGQGIFRKRVSDLEKECRLTGVTVPQLLVASHIKPWRACDTAAERLDGANGLLLAPHVDRLFDRGFITILKDGRVDVSPRLDLQDLERLGLREAVGRNCGTFNQKQEEYLAFHRERIFLS